MKTKLTLRLGKNVIEKVRTYFARKEESARKLRDLLKSSKVDENNCKSNLKALVFLPEELLRILKVKNGF